MSKYFSTIRRILRQLEQTRIGYYPIYIYLFLTTIFYFYILHITDYWLSMLGTACMASITGGSLFIAQTTMYVDSDKLKEKSRKHFTDLGFKSNCDDFYEGVFREYTIHIALKEITVDKGNLAEEIYFTVFYTTVSEDPTMKRDKTNGYKKDSGFNELGLFSYSQGLFKSISFDSKYLDYEKYLNDLIDFMIKNDLKPITSTEWNLIKNACKEIYGLN